MDNDLEPLYREAQSALKDKNYACASDLLRQILKADVNYKDAAQLLARAIKLSRRRWYNDPRLWAALAVLLLIGFGIYLFPKLQGLAAQPEPSLVVPPTVTSVPTVIPPATTSATATSLPIPTPIPISWKRISIGQEFERDTVTAIVIDPKDPEVLYAGMKNAGIFKSIDGGLSWRPAHQGLANAQVTSLLIDFQDPRILYAGTIDGTYKTDDGGENWSRFSDETFLLMDPQDSSHLYKRDSNNIYTSTDQGKSWETVYTSKIGCPGEILGWAIHPTDSNTLFVGGGEKCQPGVYLSNDGGHTWTQLVKVEIRVGGYTIHDMGLDKLTIGLDRQGNYYIRMSAYASSFERGVKHYENGIWKTILELDDKPATFDSAGSVYFHCDTHLCKFDLDERQKATLGKPEVGEFTVIAGSPQDANILYVGGQGISVSKDGGLTWSKLNNGLGSTLLQLEAGVDKNALYLLLGGCQEIRISQTGNKGREKEIIQSLYFSTNGGNSWVLSTNMGCNLIKDINGITLYRVSINVDWREDTGVYWMWRSQDGGKSWENAAVPASATTITADSAQSGLLYLYLDYDRGEGVNHHQYISEDYGHTWRANNPEVEVKNCYGSTLRFIDANRPMAIDPFDGSHVFVIDHGTLLESHDSCETTDSSGTVPNKSMNSIAFDRNTPGTLYAGTDEGAYISFDYGESWNQINDGLLGATVVYSIAVNKDGNVYAATPYGIFILESK